MEREYWKLMSLYMCIYTGYQFVFFFGYGRRYELQIHAADFFRFEYFFMRFCDFGHWYANYIVLLALPVIYLLKTVRYIHFKRKIQHSMGLFFIRFADFYTRLRVLLKFTYVMIVLTLPLFRKAKEPSNLKFMNA